MLDNWRNSNAALMDAQSPAKRLPLLHTRFLAAIGYMKQPGLRLDVTNRPHPGSA